MPRGWRVEEQFDKGTACSACKGEGVEHRSIAGWTYSNKLEAISKVMERVNEGRPVTMQACHFQGVDGVQNEG